MEALYIIKHRVHPIIYIGISRNSVSLILKGTSYENLPGPVAGKDYTIPWRTNNVK